MPCSDYNDRHYVHVDPDGLSKEQRDARTRLACDRIKWLRKNDKPIPKWAKSYVRFHDRQDAARKRAEALEVKRLKLKAEQEEKRAIAYARRKKVLAKLSPEDREALGISDKDE